jgi:hypothetical protein
MGIEPKEYNELTAGEVARQNTAVAAEESPDVWTFESHRQDCPHCGRRIMKAASLCGYCWARLEPILESPEMLAVNEGPVIRAVVSRPAEGNRRPCTTCGKMIMADAALCGFCWACVPG